MFTRDALALARQRGLDLVEVAPNESPPVCKFMDYGKFRYEQTKKDRDSRKTQKQVVIKEVRFSPKIDDHDIETKTKMVKRFLEEGNKVKLTVRFKGRELAHPELGRAVLEQVRLDLGENAVIELAPKMEGKSMTMIVSLKPAKSAAPRPVAIPRPATPATPAASGEAGAEAAPRVLPAVGDGSRPAAPQNGTAAPVAPRPTPPPTNGPAPAEAVAVGAATATATTSNES